MLCLFIVALLATSAYSEFAVTQAYTDYLKKHVTWEVVDYEDNIFKGYTIEEIQQMLIQGEMEEASEGKDVEVSDSLPEEIDWTVMADECIHEIRDQGKCGSCWAFSAAGVVSDRCCLRLKKDEGWLSPQELVSCDTQNHGCNGGWEFNALDYVKRNGLVHEACFPYTAQNSPCPNKCKDGKTDWKGDHVCRCGDKVFCRGKDAMKTCLKTGPITVGIWVYRDFLSYKSGVYHWNKQGSSLGGHALRTVGYSETPEPNWKVANSWGKNWGESGYVRIGVGEAAIESRNPSYCDPHN